MLGVNKLKNVFERSKVIKIVNKIFVKKQLVPAFVLLIPGLLAFKNHLGSPITKPLSHSIKTPLLIDPQDTFPVPKGNPNQLFYLQRTSNTNTIVCELNLKANGQINEEYPVHVFWIHFAEGGQRKELNYIQRVFAYGIKAELIEKEIYKLQFVSYKKRAFFLRFSQKDNKYQVYSNINNREAILNRIFIKVEGGTFWVPNIKYVELKGWEVVSGKEIV